VRRIHIFVVLLLTVGFLGFAMPADADDEGYLVDGIIFDSRADYLNSEYFKIMGRRCGTPSREELPYMPPVDGAPADCSLASTTIDPAYNPGDIFEIPVVVHVIYTTAGVGNISDFQVESQIDILNEDFMALAGTPGANGTMTGIQFRLEAINRVENNTYFNCSYPCNAMKIALRWDTNLYLNVYTNSGDGYLGWATLPQTSAGSSVDGVVCAWNAFGRNSPYPPYNQGRTATHEIGHWVGLFHTFQDGCGVTTSPGCYSSADTLCDTSPDQEPHYYCTPGVNCGSFPIPIENYMEYTNDTCMEEFTPEQMNRMRCSLINYRPSVYSAMPSSEIFSDGFENGDTDAWSNVVP